ncbi:preprotein translocase subunit SecE [Kerstersia similis]|uniref:preprotein translocase subunit SecE n=1 Tax=Kerstersia similis TaxID=206505 RepID=UPI0039EF50A8
MSNTNVETVSRTADRVKLVLAVLVVVAGIYGFSALSAQPLVARVSVFLGSLVLAAVIVWFSEPGRRFAGFAHASYEEVRRRVTWPTRKETVQMTGVVFAFVIVMSILLWFVDKLIQWGLYDLLMGWN